MGFKLLTRTASFLLLAWLSFFLTPFILFGLLFARRHLLIFFFCFELSLYCSIDLAAVHCWFQHIVNWTEQHTSFCWTRITERKWRVNFSSFVLFYYYYNNNYYHFVLPANLAQSEQTTQPLVREQWLVPNSHCWCSSDRQLRVSFENYSFWIDHWSGQWNRRPAVVEAVTNAAQTEKTAIFWRFCNFEKKFLSVPNKNKKSENFYFE